MSANSEARLVFTNLSAFHQKLKKYDSSRKSVGLTAVKVELFRLWGVLKKDLKSGGVGASRFKPLQVISRGTNRNKKPLQRLATAVRYNVTKVGNITHMSVGFDGPQSSKSWRRIAHGVQDGFTVDVDKSRVAGTLRHRLAWRGAQIEKRDRQGIAHFFFLKKETKELKHPARPIIKPFWRAHDRESERNIISNFNRKLLGERI